MTSVASVDSKPAVTVDSPLVVFVDSEQAVAKMVASAAEIPDSRKVSKTRRTWDSK